MLSKFPKMEFKLHLFSIYIPYATFLIERFAGGAVLLWQMDLGPLRRMAPGISLLGIALVGTVIACAEKEESAVPVPEIKAAPSFCIRVADTDCRVLIANVNLTIGDLVLSEHKGNLTLTGTYHIEVPIRSSKNETGGMFLPLKKDLSSYMTSGGTLYGRGVAYTRETNDRIIECEIIPDSEKMGSGEIRLAIDTGKRIMHFSSTYRCIGDPNKAEKEVRLSPGIDTAADRG